MSIFSLSRIISFTSILIAIKTWQISNNKFNLQFSFVEYYGLVIWTGIIIIYIAKYANDSIQQQQQQLVRFQYKEIMLIIHIGLLCTVFALFSIAQLLSKIIPIKSVKQYENISSSHNEMNNNIIQRGLFFGLLFLLSIFTTMLPSMRYILRGQNPIKWIIEFLFLDSYKRLYLCVYWVVLVIIFISVAYIIGGKYSKLPKFYNRKIFHLLIVLIILPATCMEELLSFTILAMGVALCAFITLETFRIMILTHGGGVIDNVSSYYGLFLDEKDMKRPWISSNISLLVGSALPLFIWASFINDFHRSSTANSIGDYSIRKPYHPDILESKNNNRMDSSNIILLEAVGPLFPHLGWITVGVGDSFAAIIGYHFGRHRWKGSFRTIEGSLGMFLSMFLVSIFIIFSTKYDKYFNNYDRLSASFSMKVLIPLLLTMVFTTIMEALTSENDNLILPLFSMGLYVIFVFLAVS